jgi:hypothetical protein
LRAKFTLPELEEELDGLTEGASFPISSWDYERLFGANDVAAARLRNFAASLACHASHANNAIFFRKQFPWREGDELTSTEA